MNEKSSRSKTNLWRSWFTVPWKKKSKSIRNFFATLFKTLFNQSKLRQNITPENFENLAQSAKAFFIISYTVNNLFISTLFFIPFQDAVPQAPLRHAAIELVANTIRLAGIYWIGLGLWWVSQRISIIKIEKKAFSLLLIYLLSGPILVSQLLYFIALGSFHIPADSKLILAFGTSDMLLLVPLYTIQLTYVVIYFFPYFANGFWRAGRASIVFLFLWLLCNSIVNVAVDPIARGKSPLVLVKNILDQKNKIKDIELTKQTNKILYNMADRVIQSFVEKFYIMGQRWNRELPNSLEELKIEKIKDGWDQEVICIPYKYSINRFGEYACFLFVSKGPNRILDVPEDKLRSILKEMEGLIFESLEHGDAYLDSFLHKYDLFKCQPTIHTESISSQNLAISLQNGDIFFIRCP